MHPLLPAGYLVHAQISIKVFGREDNKGQCGNGKADLPMKSASFVN